MRYRVEVRVIGETAWVGNQVTYDSEALAVSAAQDLMWRWLLVSHWRVLDEQNIVVAQSDGPIAPP